jgi:uncharacterized protein (DUF2147 family)
MVLCFTFLSVVGFVRSASPVGLWTTIDDETGVKKSMVEIYEAEDGQLEGRVVEILHSDRGPNPRCTECKGDRKDQPILRMVILWGMRANEGEGEWTGGRILDPTNGKEYKCRLRLLPDDKLEVRGFIGFSLLGRSQEWQRVEGNDD